MISRNMPRGLPPQKGERWRKKNTKKYVKILDADGYVGGIVEYFYIEQRKESTASLERFLVMFVYDPED